MSHTRFLRSALLAAACGAASLTPAFAQEKITINYNRCDGSYNGWGLHVFQRGPGGPSVPGVSWGNPLDPAGKNDFGVYWTVKLEDFPANKVNYIIHKGENKEQGGKDMQFDGGATKEIWVNSSDSKIYTSLDEAKKGREATPCK